MSAQSELANALAEALGTAPSALLCLLFILILFALLAKICDEAIAPSLERAANWLKVPPDVACATFLALGSSAPEIFISCISTAVHVNDTEGAQDVSMGTIFGSALIAFTIIPALCVFVSPRPFMPLELVPLLRDAGFFSIGLLAFILFVRDGVISWRECLVLVSLFLVYLISMRFLIRFYASPSVSTDTFQQGEPIKLIKRGKEEEEEGDAEGNGGLLEEKREEDDSFEDQELGDDDVQMEPRPLEEREVVEKLRCYDYLMPPFGASETTLDRRWMVILFISILYVAVIGEGCLEMTTAIAALLRISDHILGVFLVAFGAQIPDTFASIAVAQEGEGPGAVANAIGSQVLNILIGLGLPFMISSAVRDKTIKVDFSTATSSGVALFLAVVVFLVLTTRRRCCHRCCRGYDNMNSVGLSRTDATLLLMLYAGFAAWEIASTALRDKPSSSETQSP